MSFPPQPQNVFSKLSMFWRFQLAGWAAFIAATFPLKFELTLSLPSALLVMFVRDGSSFLFTLLLREIYRRFWSEMGGKMATLIITACTGAGILQSGLFYLLKDFVPLIGEFFGNRMIAYSVFYERTGLLFGWSFLYLGMRHALQSRQRQLELALAKTAQQGAELQMLRAQTNPHFLFNALNAIRAGVEETSPSLGRMVQSLSDFLRFSLDHSRSDQIPLGREFDAIRDYLAVEKVRFRKNLEFTCEIEPSLRAALVPGIILQPLVENAIKYGQETSEFPLQVAVRINTPKAGTIRMEVSNSGRWLEPRTREKESHLGLQNLRHRLELLYPDRHSFDIKMENGFVQVRFEIPVL